MNAFSTLFPLLVIGIFIVAAITIARNLFTKKGRNTVAMKNMGGATILQDLGELADNKIQLGHQKIRVLKCEKDSQQFLVLEVRDIRKAFLAISIQMSYVRVDKALLSQLDGFLER